MKPVVSIVAALIPEYGIGYNGTLPWKLKQEMQYFKKITTQTIDPLKKNAVIMGRKTWESIPPKFRPLPGRLNVVISSTYPETWGLLEPSTSPTSTSTSTSNLPSSSSSSSIIIKYNNLQQSISNLQKMNDIERIYIIGGAQVYNATFDMATHLLITEIQMACDSQASSQPIPPPMDTFLDSQSILNSFTKKDTQNWNSFTLDALRSQDTYTEGEYKFQFTLYEPKTA